MTAAVADPLVVELCRRRDEAIDAARAAVARPSPSDWFAQADVNTTLLTQMYAAAQLQAYVELIERMDRKTASTSPARGDVERCRPGAKAASGPTPARNDPPAPASTDPATTRTN